MSYVKSLRSILEEKDEELFKRLDEIEKQARNVLQYTQAKFPYYTPHGFLHSENVLENLNWLLSEDVKNELNGHELFFLIISAWLHDWGMVGEPDEKPEGIREEHNVRTEENFEKLYSLVGVHLNEARVIGRICRGHRKESLYDDKYEDTSFETGIVVHRRFLTAALRMADEIDITASRVPEIIYYSLNPTEKSKEEFTKQMNIIGIAYPSERERHKLALNAIAWDPLGVVVLKKLREKIQEELNHTKTILATGINGKGLSLDYVELRVDTRGFMKESIEFELDREKILDLLIGRSLYSRKDTAIRELVQNAIDACRLRRAVEGDFPAEIEIIESEETIIVEDNGIGMDFETAKKYLSLIGSAFYLSDDFRKMVSENKSFDPISRWGLGILSCFLISSSVNIETKRMGSQPCRFVIPRIDRGWRYEIGSTNRIGTRVTLVLNEEGRKIDTEEALDYYVKASEIPIFLNKKGKKERFIPRWSLEVELSKLADDPDNAWQIERFGVPRVGFSYHIEREEFDATFYELDWRGTLFPPIESWFICLQGIKTRMPKMEKNPQMSEDVYTFLNIKKNIVDYEVSRECLVANEKLDALIYKVFLAYYDALKKDFDQTIQTEKMNAFERDVRFAGFLRSRISSNRFGPSEKRELILNTTYALLSSEGRTDGKLDSILDHRPSKILLLALKPLNTFQENMRFVENSEVLLRNLKKGEIALFCPASLLFNIEGVHDEIRKLFCGIDCEISNIKQYIIQSSQRVATPIDGILPPNCHFAKIPKEFATPTIKVHGFAVADTSDEYLLREVERNGDFLVFEDMPVISKNVPFTHDLERLLQYRNKISSGEYLLNAEERTLKILIDNADKVLSKKALLEAAKIYVRSLIVCQTGYHDILNGLILGSWSYIGFLLGKPYTDDFAKRTLSELYL